jgi:hypothetical protein
MEPLNTPLNDDELKQALQKWRAPNAPASLERKVLGREPWWRWLLSGSVRIPVPALIAAAVVLIALYAGRGRVENDPPEVPTVSLADFQPVSTVEVKVVRRSQ